MKPSMALPLAALVSWQGLGLVVLFAVIAGTVIVGAFSIALVGLDHWSASRDGTARSHGGPSPSPPSGDVTHAATPVGVGRDQVAFGSLAMAIIGLAVCVLAVVLGLWSMVAK